MSKNNEPLKSCTYFIDGMHCSSCELLIEKKLLKEENVEFANASLNQNKVDIKFKGDYIKPEYLSDLFKDVGYKFSVKKIYNQKSEPVFKISNNRLVINKSKLKEISSAIFVAIVIIGLYLALQNNEIFANFTVNSTTSYISFFVFGLLAGLSSCAALVGGLLLSLSKKWNELHIDSSNNFEKFLPYGMFNIGRIVSFTILGGVLGAVGSAIGLSIEGTSTFTSYVILAISILMLILGLQMLGVKWATKFSFALPKSITGKIVKSESYKGKFVPFIIGALTFFLPCGFTLIAQGIALTSGDFTRGALTMFSFVLGTTPILLGIGLTSLTLSKKPRLNALFTLISGVLVIVFSIYNFNSQLNVLGFKSLDDIRLPKIPSSNVKTINNDDFKPELGEDGYQVVKIEAVDFKYIPRGNTTIKAGIPTKMVIENNGILGCGAYLVSRGLLNRAVYLQDGINEIDLGSPSKGVYKVTCSMGMVPPVTIKVI